MKLMNIVLEIYQSFKIIRIENLKSENMINTDT